MMVSSDVLRDTVARWVANNREQITGNDAAFLSRVYQTGLTKYQERLRAISFCGLRHVLDAGCGFGQWTLSLSGLNEAVSACDISPARISALQELALALGKKNIEAEVSSLEPLPYPDAHFDGVFCYSVLPLVGWREALREIHRVAKPGGVIYVNANAIGYYANLWLNRPNEAEGYDARMLVADAFAQTLEYERTGKFRGGCLMIDREDLISFLAGLGFEQIMSGGEGTLRLGAGGACPSPFFELQYYGLPGVYEVLARKPLLQGTRQ